MSRLTMVAVAVVVLAAACGADVAPSVESQSDGSTSTAAAREAVLATTTSDPGPAAPSDEPVDDATTPVTDSPSMTEAAESEEANQPSTTKKPEPVPPPKDGEGGASVGEVPAELLGRIIDAVAASSGVPGGAIIVLRAESIIWPDGSLGCPEPGMIYTDAPVDGYWIELDAAGEKLDYRATTSGFFRSCAAQIPLGPTG